MNPRRRLETCGLDCVQRIQRADRTGLHVASTPTVHFAVLHHRRKWRRLPHLERPSRNHIAMALQDERLPCDLSRTVGADHSACLGKIMLDRTEATQTLQLVNFDMPVVDLITPLPQKIANHILARSFGSAGGGNRDEILCGGKLRVEIGADSLENSLFFIERVHWLPCSWSLIGLSLLESRACQ